MYGRFMRSLVAVVLMTGAVVLSNAHPATAQAPPPPPLTEWCAAQQELGPESVSVEFECLDEGISDTTSTRSVRCVCLDAAGNILSSSTLGGAGAAVISVGGSSSSSSAVASGTATSGR
ncbi:hypothetical protein Ndes2526B_g00167 [Nannochloris sp. 'desiccata']|nr:hypothetical protein KSW81_002979 [Chlorella desiccata (nom. nud.)]KAH7624800.1 hypothetical protein NADE_002022 [Chlorella desiccata (nom. nud.)]